MNLFTHPINGLFAKLLPRGYFEDDWRARPTPKRPWPVILVHGTALSNGDWVKLGRDLREDGWAVFAPAFGKRATGRLAASAEQVGAYIDAVLAATNAEQCIVVGHSQGGLIARYWMHRLGGVAKVRHLVCLSAPNHGAAFGGPLTRIINGPAWQRRLTPIIGALFGEAGFDQITGAETIEAINNDGETLDGVTYTCFATKNDYVVIPSESCFLDGARNLYVQDAHPGAIILHNSMVTDRRVRRLVVEDLATEARR